MLNSAVQNVLAMGQLKFEKLQSPMKTLHCQKQLIIAPLEHFMTLEGNSNVSICYQFNGSHTYRISIIYIHVISN